MNVKKRLFLRGQLINTEPLFISDLKDKDFNSKAVTCL